MITAFLRNGIFALTVLTTAPIIYMAMDTQQPYEWLSGEIVPDPANDGAQINVHWRIKIIRHCPGIIQRQIIDSREVIHNYDPVPATAPRDVSTDFWVTFKLPENLPAGPSRYRIHAEYTCNILQHVWPIHAETVEVPFLVLNNKGSEKTSVQQ